MINKFLLAGNKFMPEMHLKNIGFAYSASGPFTKNKERVKNLKKQHWRDIYQNELDKACFQHDIAYGHFKDLKRRTVADEELRNKALNIVKNQKHD